MKATRIVDVIFVLLFSGAALGAAAFLLQDFQQLDTLRTENSRLARQAEVLETEVAARETQLVKLDGDREYIESVIRSKLSYAREGETIFRFQR